MGRDLAAYDVGRKIMIFNLVSKLSYHVEVDVEIEEEQRVATHSNTGLM